MSKKKVAILISGRGSNMEALIKACQDATFPASVELVISNKKEAYGLEIAQSYGIQTESLNRKNFQTDHEFDSKISTILKENNIEIICTAGYMKILTKDFVESWHNQIINIHPSLLPKFGGKGMYGYHVHKAVIKAHETESGITIHFVNEKYDDGAIIFQNKVTIKKSETAESLEKKIKNLELRYYPEIIDRVVRGLI